MGFSELTRFCSRKLQILSAGRVFLRKFIGVWGHYEKCLKCSFFSWFFPFPEMGELAALHHRSIDRCAGEATAAPAAPPIQPAEEKRERLPQVLFCKWAKMQCISSPLEGVGQLPASKKKIPSSSTIPFGYPLVSTTSGHPFLHMSVACSKDHLWNKENSHHEESRIGNISV